MSVAVSGSWRRSDEHQWTAGYKFHDRTFYQPTVFWNTANKGNHEVKGEDSSLMNAEPTIRESLRLLEKVEWLEPDTLDHLVQWSGLESGTEHSCWKNIGDIIEPFSNEFNFPRIRSNGKLKTDGKAASKGMKLISFLQYKLKRDITAVIFIRDLDKGNIRILYPINSRFLSRLKSPAQRLGNRSTNSKNYLINSISW